MESENLLSYAQAAELLNLKKGTLFSLVSRRQVPFIRLGKRIVRFSPSQLQQWLCAREVAATEIVSDGSRDEQHATNRPLDLRAKRNAEGSDK